MSQFNTTSAVRRQANSWTGTYGSGIVGWSPCGDFEADLASLDAIMEGRAARQEAESAEAAPRPRVGAIQAA